MKTLIEYINENKSEDLNILYKFIKQHQGEEDFAFSKPIRKKQQLVFHFSGPDEVKDIMKHGFTRGTTLEHIKNTQEGFHSDENGKYCFAYDLKTFINDWYGCSAYGEFMSVAIVDCVQCNHIYDGDVQCIFVKGTENPIACFELDIERYSWGREVTFKRLDKKMRPCVSVRELLFESDFAKELNVLGIYLEDNKDAKKLLKY